MGNFSLLYVIMIFLMISTVIVVIIGIAKLSGVKNKNDRKNNNKLMMLRISLQTLIIFIVAIGYFFKR